MVALVLLVASMFFFLFGAIAAHEGGALLGESAVLWACIGLICFAAAHLPLGEYTRRK